MTQIRSAPLPTDLARTDTSQTWTGTQDFTAATVLGITGGSGGGTVSGATATAAGVVQLAGDLAGPYTAPTVPGLTDKLAAASNLADLASAATARTNLGLGSAATQPATAFDAAGAAGTAAGTAQAFAVQRANHTGTQPASTVTGLAAVATSGSYTDLTNTPTVPTTYLRVKAANTTTTGTAYLNDPDLQVASLPVGTYAWEFHLVTASTAVAQTGFGTNNAAGMAGGTTGIYSGSTVGGFFNLGSTLYCNAGQRASQSGSLVVTTAGLFALTYTSNTGGSLAGFGPGSWLRLTKLA